MKWNYFSSQNKNKLSEFGTEPIIVIFFQAEERIEVFGIKLQMTIQTQKVLKNKKYANNLENC